MSEHLFSYFPLSISKRKNGFDLIIEQLQNNNVALKQFIDEFQGMISGLVADSKADTQKIRVTIADLISGQESIAGLTDEILQKLRELQNMITGVNDELLSMEKSAVSPKMIEEILVEMRGLSSRLTRDDWLIDVRFEREYYKDFPLDDSYNTSFQKELMALTSGLDYASIETIIVALQRLRLIRDSDDPMMYLYSQQERNVMQSIPEHFLSNIYKLSENCWFYHRKLLPINHFEICVFLDELMVPELEHPERFADKDIIDAGAYIGDSALILSPLTTGTVYAFEPLPANFELLKKTVAMNALTNVTPCAVALGSEAGTVRLSVRDTGSVSTQFPNEAIEYSEKVDAPVVKLDDFVKEQDLHVGLIKMDVEGAEQLLLRGAMETIRSQKPALLISIYHNADDFFHIKPMLEALGLGYKFKIRHSVGGTVMIETVLIAEVS